jgi:large subunit ribosomal protein L21
MSFAIFKTGGKQYKVQTSQILKIEKLESPDNKKIEFNEILAYGNKEKVELGSPLIKGAKIEAELIKNSKERTILVFKKRRRKNSRKKYGHRQPFTLIKISKIFSKDGKILAAAEKKTENTPKVIKESEKKKTVIKKKSDSLIY